MFSVKKKKQNNNKGLCLPPGQTVSMITPLKTPQSEGPPGGVLHPGPRTRNLKASQVCYSQYHTPPIRPAATKGHRRQAPDRDTQNS